MVLRDSFVKAWYRFVFYSNEQTSYSLGRGRLVLSVLGIDLCHGIPANIRYGVAAGSCGAQEAPRRIIAHSTC